MFVLLDLREYEGAQVSILETLLLQGDHKSLRFGFLKHLKRGELRLQVLGEGRNLVPVSMVKGEFKCSVLPLWFHDLIDTDDHGVVSCEPPKNNSFLRDCLLDGPIGPLLGILAALYEEGVEELD